VDLPDLFVSDSDALLSQLEQSAAYNSSSHTARDREQIFSSSG
jgi:hypothetical protein